MILSHRIGLALLDRKNQEPLAGRNADVRFGVLDRQISRKLDRLAALAARLTRLGSRDLPLPTRLHRFDLPPSQQVVADATAWSIAGPPPVGSLQAMAPAPLRSRHGAVAVMPAPTRAVAAATSGTRTRDARLPAQVADREKGRTKDTARVVSAASVPPKRDAPKPVSRPRPPLAAVEAASPASQLRSSLAPVESALAGRDGGRSTRSGQEQASRAPLRSTALQAAGRATGGRNALSLIASRPILSDGATSVDGSVPGRKAGMESVHASPRAARGDALGGSASSSASRSLPSGVPGLGSTSDAQRRLAVLQRSVVSAPRRESSQDVLRRQVVPPAFTAGRPGAFSNGGVMQGSADSRQVAGSGAVAEGGSGTEAGRMMMVSLMGDVVIDGRRLGQVAASSQASQASLPAHGPSRVNLRAVPIHPGMQIPQ